MTINQLPSHHLVPDASLLQAPSAALLEHSASVFERVQPRLCNGLQQLMQVNPPADILLVKNTQTWSSLTMIGEALKDIYVSGSSLCGGHYTVQGNQVDLQPATSAQDNFAAQGDIVIADWVEEPQLFGCVRFHQDTLTLEPGLIHKANGGVLVMALRSVLLQPRLWLRLKQMLAQRRFDWLSPDDNRPLPVSIPSLPLSVRLVLSGDREALADFQELEPELSALAIYSEYEDCLQINTPEAAALWCNWVSHLAKTQRLPAIQNDFWPELIHEGARYTGDNQTLPLSNDWIIRQLKEAALFGNEDAMGSEAFAHMVNQRQWREDFLPERMREEILSRQIWIETDGARIGQVNALSVIEFPGHPRTFGEPSRISCVIHFGDGEFTDIERKAELGGNLHAKGMMIMQAFLLAALDLDQQLPFTASLTFEQSYSEVDGDSASMAELCALISALASAPINQSIAITGAVDQFGYMQPIGGVNEKIEGFFHICAARGLTGQQGVIIPKTNMRHLALERDVVKAVEQGTFSIWAVDNAADALTLLTGLTWSDDTQDCLLTIMKERITQANQQDYRHRYPWPLRWLNWFNHN
ncbi:Lon protease family protein [Erwinia sp. HR93]|uniref:Lon protease family protein n=1 Tax=Erwinia sp. HR93 TaxID=3094840 RepID=UPI002ADEA9A3|nr:Lon protease family protein [Erwinia sp. HR93]MEA1064684.1 Lon protease family protein [Erwinia sp. HR93]